VLCSSVEFSETLAANLLGVEPGDDEATGKGVDAIGEILNIVAGIVMDRLATGGLEVRIGTPTVRVMNMQEHHKYVQNALSRSFLLSDDGDWVDIAAVATFASDR
jgi:CheY-specific phosphatase CheX